MIGQSSANAEDTETLLEFFPTVAEREPIGSAVGLSKGIAEQRHVLILESMFDALNRLVN